MTESPMTKSEFLELLQRDLSNEVTHMHFYLFYASNITGLHRHEYKEVFLKEAASEMAHVTQFSDFIIGLGGKSHIKSKEFDTTLTRLSTIIDAAKNMEEAYEVIQESSKVLMDLRRVKPVHERLLDQLLLESKPVSVQTMLTYSFINSGWTKKILE